MAYKVFPANTKPETVYRRTGTIGRIMNTVRPLKHEPERKDRLRQALIDGNTELALHLIRNTGMTARDLNKLDFEGERLIHRARNADVIQALVAAGADVNARAWNSWTALFFALHYAHNTETIQALIAAGADVNAKDSRGGTPLHSPLKPEDAQTLIAAGADVNAKDDEKSTPLHHVYNPETAQALIAAGADVNAKDFTGRTPLHGRTPYNDVRNDDFFQVLIAAGADVNAKDFKGMTPLHDTRNRDVHPLIAAGADVNAKDLKGKTPLHYVINAATAQALIEAGADVNAKDLKGKTPLNYARSDELIEVLLGDVPMVRSLNIPITERAFNLTHNTDPVSLNTINEGDEYYTINSNVNPYSRGTIERLLKTKNPISPITRQPIVDIRKHKRPSANANANANATSGGRKRTRKQRKSNRKMNRKTKRR